MGQKKKSVSNMESSDSSDNSDENDSKRHLNKLIASSFLNSKKELIQKNNMSFTGNDEISPIKNRYTDDDADDSDNGPKEKKKSSKSKRKSKNVTAKASADLKNRIKQEDTSDSGEDENNTVQKILTDVKKEILSEDSEPSLESKFKRKIDSNTSVKRHSKSEPQISKRLRTAHSENFIDNVATVQAQTQSESEDSDPPRSSVTVLQDIRITPKKKTPKEQMNMLYGDLTPLEITAELLFSDSDEVHLLRIPKSLNPKSLKKVELNLENGCIIELQQKYVVNEANKVPDLALVISNHSRVLQIKSNITVEKYIEPKKEKNLTVQEIGLVPLPENLKQRHPLFGAHFENMLKLNDHVELGLEDTMANIFKRIKKAKKKKAKKIKHEEEEEEEPNQEIFNLFNINKLEKKKGKVKEEEEDSAFGSSSSIDKRKEKSKKAKNRKEELAFF